MTHTSYIFSPALCSKIHTNPKEEALRKIIRIQNKEILEDLKAGGKK